MAKLKTDPITQTDLVEFLNDYSDFSFEIQILHALIDRGLSCEHGGTYDDPSTNKPREFDIRATLVDRNSFLRLAVECKNLRPNFPLLISCMPRRKEESFHEIVFSVNTDKWAIGKVPNPCIPAMLPKSTSVRLTHDRTFYQVGGAVGKSCDQVGRSSLGHIIATDSNVYEKWAQSLSSADELTALSCYDGEERTRNVALSVVFPILVVPNGSLWITSYDDNGSRVSDPLQTDRCSYYVNRTYFHRSVSGGEELTLSHLEIVTRDGLLTFVDELCGDNCRIEKTFPWEDIAELLPSVTKLE